MLPLPRELLRFRSPPRPCSYLPDETASLDYRVHALMSAEQFRERLRRGWRRHGAHFFRPACPTCVQCRSLRVLVEKFRPTRSQRRILNRNTDLRIVVQPPTVSDRHIELFNAYHADMHIRRGWPVSVTTAEDYEESFLVGIWPFAREMLFYRGTELIGVSLLDVVADAVSSVYFYHDPAWRPRAPGTFSILQELEFCRQTGRRYNYLGFWISECPSMSYKARFRPHEILTAPVDDSAEPEWLLVADH